MTGQHLTDEEFTELLSGDRPADASLHLQQCAQCQWEFNRVQAAIEDFGSVALEWAEQRAPASLPTRSAFVREWQPVSRWTAAAAVLVAAILVGVHQEERIGSPGIVRQASAHPAHSESEVADDNRLMMAIDKEIRWQAESPVAVDSVATADRRPASRKLAN